MKIVSKYKDYYDGVQSLGSDNTLIYVRHQETLMVNKPSDYNSYVQNQDDTLELDRINLETGDYRPQQEHIDCKEVIVGFCGKMYPGIVFNHIKDNTKIGIKVLFSTIDTLNYISQLKAKYRKLYYRCSFYNYNFQEPKEDFLGNYFDQKVFNKDYTSWFQEFNTPVFVFTTDPNQKKKHWNDKANENKLYIVSNPKLKDLEFFRVKSNYIAYQELSQFIGGVMTNTEIDSTNLTDIEKVQQHGFDKKYGFRTRPKKSNDC